MRTFLLAGRAYNARALGTLSTADTIRACDALNLLPYPSTHQLRLAAVRRKGYDHWAIVLGRLNLYDAPRWDLPFLVGDA